MGEYVNHCFARHRETKKLESFTQPRIFEEFMKELNTITSAKPRAVIQVYVPLMIELNLQYLFHKLLVVYTPEEIQIQRLTELEGLSRDEAVSRVRGELSIKEKAGYADFVVNHENSLQETQKQVDEIWEKILKLQKE